MRQYSITKPLKYLAVGAVAAVAWAAAGQAQDAGLSIADAWMRALPNHLPAAGYFTIENKTDKAATLVGASSPACKQLMLHRTVTESGTARMEMVDHVDVPAGGSLSFAPGGYHLMCMMPSADVSPGKTVPVTLDFDGGTSLHADFQVRNAAGK
jgi:copper(I)-binding protein